MSDPPIQVTFCTYDSPNTIGGPFSWMERLFPLLRERGIEARALFLLHDGQPGPTLKKLRSEGFVCTASTAHDTTHERVRWILEELQKAPPDIFIPNLVVAAYYAGRWVKKAGIPTVGILHSDDSFYRAIVDQFGSGSKASRLTDLVCVSRLLESQLLDMKLEAVSVHRIPYGVPHVGSRPDAGPNRLRIAYVGRLAEEQKRISEVTRALCRVVSEVPETEASIFGDGPDRDSMLKILEEEGADLPVSWKGSLSPNEIQETLLQQDILVLLSDYEGLPIAVLEAMAAGVVPVCLRMRSGITELIEEGKTGLIVNNRGDSFMKAVRHLQEDPELLNRLSRAARERVEKEFSLDRCADRWFGLFEELQKTSGKKRKIFIPRRFHLPRPLPGFAHQDPRPDPFLKRAGNRLARLRFHAGKWKRRFFAGSDAIS